MSSNYKVLCLSHVTALVVTETHNDPEEAISWATRAVAVGGAHEGCDLVIGRYSYPLVELICPGCRNGGMHVKPARIDADVARLVLHCYGHKEKATYQLAAKAGRCWPPARLEKLRPELFPAADV